MFLIRQGVGSLVYGSQDICYKLDELYLVETIQMDGLLGVRGG